MDTDDLILISVDDHLIEPPDLFADHLDAKYLDRAPKLVRNDEGDDVWMFGDDRDGDRGAQRRRRAAQGGVRHRAAEPRRDAARLLRRPRAGQGHGRRRRAGLDELPVVPRPSRPGSFADATTRTSSLALVRAYNDWHIDEWCGAYPGRFIPMAVPVHLGPRG